MNFIKSSLYSYPQPPPRTRTRPLRLICAGLPRSATESLSHALQELNYKPYHGWTLVSESNGGYIQEWANLARRKYAGAADGDVQITRAEFDALLGDHDAVLDSVPAMFAAELIEAYPEAKVILNTRSDLDAWHRSIMKTVVSDIEDSWVAWFVKVFNAERFWLWEFYFTYGYSGLFRSLRKGSAKEGIMRNGKWVYRDHCNMVRGMMVGDKRRLLEWEVGDGWGSLCEFLGEKVPDIPFPNGNDPVAFREQVARITAPRMRRAMRNLTLTVVSLSVVAVVTGLSFKERGVPWKAIKGVSASWATLVSLGK
ncbi:hypothetical protein BO79DRAFT_175378 [Aspergillus costaricaensis CBS 115574]|uniref:Uncharacterized protein n=1 Tax=Aspergillus costaricaensis CBS 115574 TaxID=1448317 RepID=A0ACD1IAP7_9EURO|nr:hypothetical protein BO79DRAFT_175378 [Aspergillus costaricaensis CBS 115574]RAK87664.1 hypothetical protein BO79DRAFT_175378 [Aspergillus costaricaensis CBS 115574]